MFKYTIIKKKNIFMNNITKEKLYDLYINQNLTRMEIAELLKCSEGKIKYRLKVFDIKKPNMLHVKAIQKSCLKKYGILNGGWTKKSQNKIKQSNLKKFGVEFALQSPKIREKASVTIKSKYGVDNIGQSSIIKKKIRQTMHKNNSFKCSKEEDFVYSKLLCYFRVVKRQYFSKEYPFKCDFYIPENNLYIEYQGFWMHGPHPFNILNKDDTVLYNLWKSRNKLIYKAAIETWTVRDPKKREMVKKNKLNWVEFFNLK